jgi:hypothetical protein
LKKNIDSQRVTGEIAGKVEPPGFGDYLSALSRDKIRRQIEERRYPARLSNDSARQTEKQLLNDRQKERGKKERASKPSAERKEESEIKGGLLAS